MPLNDLVANPALYLPKDAETMPTCLVCRLGNDSQIAAHALRGLSKQAEVIDLVGGLRAWARDADTEFPVY